MPEVSLVAILDADKEGFLRSENALIQTIGRAARNLNGKAILYGDTITGSMQRAIAETDRRRQVQVEFNLLHNITPRGITKAVTDVMDGGYGGTKVEGRRKVAEPKVSYSHLSPVQAVKQIKKLELEMHKHARNLEFEEAAKLRDQIHVLRQIELGLPTDGR